MRQKIKESLTNPYGKTYQVIYVINKYILYILPLFFIIIISYPTTYSIYLKITLSNQQEKQTRLENELYQQNKLLNSLQQHLQNQQDNNPSITQINQKIQHIFERYQIDTEKWQWNLSHENQLYLTFNQESNILFNILYELNQIPMLYIKEMTLTKLHHAKLVRFTATFILLN